jgi:hypothetical protein
MDDGGCLKEKLKINSHMCKSNIVKQNMQLIHKDQLNKHIRFNKHTTSSVDQSMMINQQETPDGYVSI